MFSNIALDVFVGLVFVFLLYSLLATIFQEFLSQIFDLRAKMLQKGIARMLRDDNKGKQDDPDNALWKRFYDNPGIRYLSESNSFILRNRPSYISAASFSRALMQILRGEDYDGSKRAIDEIRRILAEAHAYNQGQLQQQPEVIIGPQTLRQLNNLLVDAQQDTDRFITLVEEWFNNTMSRVSGWYKRQTRWILLVMGIVIAVAANVDTIRIYSILARDKTAREQMVNIALRSQQAASNVLLDSVYKDVQNDLVLSRSILGMGWNDRYFRRFTPIGWLLTALAISLGAPFWFDLLNKLVKLRAAGGRPDEGKDKNKGRASGEN
ncbi:hypothetical protein Q4E93_32715 [Flavitalea sp. BT771]|uniref:hypothetical protein n=1 Tax=Flavitalea sp. BT771 TaxID=3063329 RepID=UPI0026E174B1|nr:hypothetical protein [Flavitalea sp. BT771]MDO6435423.1 hypothetical protein [Flavitalea sp. BT771]MDV6224217.1 hypothetical protein [Flavitalea sp. BT771]